MIDVEKLKKLHEDATPGPWVQANLANVTTRRDEHENGAVTEYCTFRLGDDKLLTYLRNSVPAILALAEERERMREALDRINKAPTVMDGGSIQWCRNLAAKTLRALGEEKAS